MFLLRSIYVGCGRLTLGFRGLQLNQTVGCSYAILVNDMPTWVDARSKAYVCGRLVAGVAVSNPAEGMDVCLLCCPVQVEVSETG
jgi:hypothetical protein